MNRNLYLVFIITLFLVFSVWTGFTAGKEQEAFDIGTKRQFFFDDMLIESSKGITIRMNPPLRTGHVVLKADAPWEKALHGHIGAYCSLIKEDDNIRLWYDVRFGGTVQVAYAESKDGIHFTKPIVGRYELDGSKENNIVMPNRIGGGSVWIDPHAPPDKKYRSQSKGYNPPTSGKLYCYHSADGIEWTLWQYQDIGNCDTQSIAFWDYRIMRYVLYTRKNPNAGTPARSRVVRRLESDDLEHWENEVIVMAADEIDDATYVSPTPKPPVDYYGAAIFRYPNADGPYVMLSQAFWHFKRRIPERRWGISGKKDPRSGEKLAPSTIDVRLAFSHDGLHFQRLGGRKPFLNLGPEGAFDSRMVWAIPNPIIMGDQIWIYYAGKNTDHDGYTDPTSAEPMSGIGLAVMRLDGFISADADYTGGQMTTHLMTFQGKRLIVNLDTGGGGSLQVEILDKSGKPIDGYTQADATVLCGNSVKMPVTWNKNQDVSELSGYPIRLRFTMRDCKLYAFSFVD
jgi:hypothetical protein